MTDAGHRGPLAERLRARIASEGPLSFAAWTEAVLYDPDGGFYARGGRAGRRGDFLTSPEAGPLFGAVVARALDRWWEELGRPVPFVVVEAGAGPGTLARAVRAAGPSCAAALVYLLVERSDAQRALHGDHLPGWVGDVDGPGVERLVAAAPPGPVFVSSVALPEVLDPGVVVANELLDNLPFEVVRRAPRGWEQLAVAAEGDAFVPVGVPAATGTAAALAGLDAGGEVPDGVWVPCPTGALAWVGEVLGRLRSGRLVVVDYAATTGELARRPDGGWLRTFRGHERGGDPLADPGSQDVTADVALDQLTARWPPTSVTTQARFLAEHGIDELVAEGRRIWEERAHLGDLEAMRGRSRVREAEALTDPDGLGAFTVVEWSRP